LKVAIRILPFVIGVLAAPAMAADYDVGALHIEQPWARATPKGASVGGGYMKITNTGTASDRLTCVSIEVAARCEVHSMTLEDGVMKMRPVPNGLEIKPGETVELKPGSLHVMFIDLKRALEPGKSVAATLKFEKAGTVEVQYAVEPIGAPAPSMHGMHAQ
jgi:copper(I)-binding protein